MHPQDEITAYRYDRDRRHRQMLASSAILGLLGLMLAVPVVTAVAGLTAGVIGVTLSVVGLGCASATLFRIHRDLTVKPKPIDVTVTDDGFTINRAGHYLVSGPIPVAPTPPTQPAMPPVKPKPIVGRSVLIASNRHQAEDYKRRYPDRWDCVFAAGRDSVHAVRGLLIRSITVAPNALDAQAGVEMLEYAQIGTLTVGRVEVEHLTD